MPRTHSISNSDNIIDSRDVIARIAELERDRDSLMDTFAEEYETQHGEAPTEDQQAQCWNEQEPCDSEELRALQNLQDEAEGYAPDWMHGAALIADSYFEDYARELADDLHGSAMRDASWPFDYIDWKAAAEALQQDYTSVDFDGETYWVR